MVPGEEQEEGEETNPCIRRLEKGHAQFWEFYYSPRILQWRIMTW